MRLLLLSLLCLAPSMHAGKDKKAKKEQRAAQKLAAKQAEQTAAFAAAGLKPPQSPQHDINCTGHCFQCDSLYMRQQSQYDK